MKKQGLTLGVYVGRFSPFHLGHAAVIDTMLQKYGPERSLVLIGSVNTKQSLRHFFTYAERRNMIKMVYPEVRIAGVPDFPEDNDWFLEVCDLIHLTDTNSFEVEFFAGCQEDVTAMSKYVNNITLVNRFDGTTPTVSATQVRDCLLYKRDVTELLHPTCTDYIVNLFDKKWKEFTKK